MLGSGPGIRLPPRWIELNLMKRECAAFIASPDDESSCQCGRRKLEHDEEILAHPPKIHRSEEWTPSRHTVAVPTDAYGQIIFEGEHHPNKSRFVRLSYDTNPDTVVQLMTLVWGMEMPKLVISVRGGAKDFELSPRLGKILQVGLLKAAKHTGAWIFTSALNCGVTKHVGNALGNERWLGFKRGRCVGVGIAPWGVIENRSDLIGRNRDRTYNQLQHAGSKFFLLSPRLSNLLLVDNGTVGKIGGDAAFRRRLARYMGLYPMNPHRGCDTPVVGIVIEGGLYTLKVVAEYLQDEPPIPVVVLGHSGRTADLLAYVTRKCDSGKELDTMKDELTNILVHLYKVTKSQCAVLLNELRRIVAKKHLLTVYVPHQTEDEGFDTIILASIFRSQHWTPLQQLSLTLAWNRVDIATNEVFVYGRDWSREHLEHAMMEALVSDRLDFVNLLLEHGLNMQLFLTPARLEGLYSLEKTHSNQMRSLLIELAKIRPSKEKFGINRMSKNLTLHEVGLAMSHMMGHIYQSKYIHLRGLHDPSALEDGGPPPEDELTGSVHTFTQPFDDLFIWAVLTKRHSMALLLWSHGPGALAKALVAVKLNRYFAEELEESENSNMAAEFQGYCEEWENLSLELLDSCFRQDPKLARQLLTMELDHWSKQTCLTLAVIANHRMLLGHPCCQMLLADLWMGALSIRRNVTIKIISGILLPPLIFCWEYKSTEELMLLPHQERHELGLLGPANFPERPRYESESVRSNRSAASIFQRSHPSARNFDGDGVTGETSINFSEINDKLKQFKRSPQDHHTRHAHFHEQQQILDSGATGSFIFDNTVVVYKDHRNHGHHGRHAAVPHAPVGSLVPDAEQPPNSGFVTTRHELSFWNKFCEFHRAPITNFYRHTMAYMIFVCILAYVILVPQDKNVAGPLEIYVISYIGSHGLDCIREFLTIDAYNWGQKWNMLKERIFVLSDFFIVCFFMVGVGLRFTPEYFSYGMLLYRVSSIYWNLRLYKYMGVHRFVGPKIVMMSRMLRHMAYFAMIILVVLIAFGIARESIRFPDADPGWRNIAEAFLEPYVMMFGEVDADALSPHCGVEDQPPCPVGYWIIPLTWAVYMMVANILIVNVLIAVFNGIYDEVNAISLELWMFQRFNFVMEFEQKPLLPPPLIVVHHVYAVIKFLFEKFVLCICEREMPLKGNEFEEARVIMGNDHSLKTFLTSAESHMVFDFEEDNVDLLNSTNEHLIKLSEKQKNNMNDAPTSGFVDKAEIVRNGPLAHVKTNLREIQRELEQQRAKLDKILEMYEIANEEDDGDEYEEQQHGSRKPQTIPSSIQPQPLIVENLVPKPKPVPIVNTNTLTKPVQQAPVNTTNLAKPQRQQPPAGSKKV